MPEIIFYEHRSKQVAVRKDLRGQHRDYCLCYQCEKFYPQYREGNCGIANELYLLNCKCGITTPVWECQEFEPK
jgi:hypothetical protein